MSDPFSVIEEALKRIESALNLSDLRARSSTKFYDAAMDSLADARAALAEIEERLRRAEAERDAMAEAMHEASLRVIARRALGGGSDE